MGYIKPLSERRFYGRKFACYVPWYGFSLVYLKGMTSENKRNKLVGNIEVRHI
jgi:hypothetical protein